MHLIFLNNLFRTLSWSFIHSLWQGLILTILAGLIMLVTMRSKASLRYGFLCVLLFLFLAGVAFTFMIEWNSGTAETSGLTFMTNLDDKDTVLNYSLLRQLFESILMFLNSNSQWIVLIWLIVLCFKLVRMTLDLIYTNRLRTHNIFNPGDEWITRLHGLSSQLCITKKVSLMESALVKVPSVVGYFKPVILIPVGILTSLPAAEVEAVLLHELAHIRRHDYLINFIQRIAELFFFFNPGFLWVSSLLHIERENCCDDIAIAKTNDKTQFVNAMISFKEHSTKNSGYVLELFRKKNLLLQRMIRIIYNRNKTLSPVELAFFVINFIAFVLLVSAIGKPNIKKQPVSISVASSVVSVASSLEHAPSFSSVPIREIQLPLKQEHKGRSGKKLPTFSGNELPDRNIAVKKTEIDRESIAMNHEQVNENFFTADRARVQIEKSEQMEREIKQTELHRLQAEKDRKQAERNREQAEIDRIQAAKDRRQALLDRQRAEKDRVQAEKDRMQADEDRLKAQKDREQAMMDRHQARLDRKKADNRKKADKDLLQNETPEYNQ